MTADHLFLGLLLALYLWECVGWAAPGAVVFRRIVGGWHAHAPALDFENRLGVPVLGFPLPPFGVLHTIDPWPLSISAEGVTTLVSSSWLAKGRVPGPVVTIPLHEIDSVEPTGRDLLVNGRRLVRCGSSRTASRMTDLIGDLLDLDEDRRSARIDVALETWLDEEDAERRLRAGARPIAHVRTLGNLLFLHLVVVTPVLSATRGLSDHWPWLLGVAVMLEWLITTRFWLAHRRLHPEARGDRFAGAFSMALYPPAAMRAHQKLAWDLIGDVHPLAAAKHLLDEAHRADLADRVRRDLDHPVPPLDEPDGLTRDVVEFFDARLRLALDGRLAGSGDSVHGADEADRCCPRCLEPFTFEAEVTECSECRLALVGGRSRKS